MTPKPFQQESYRTKNGVRAPRIPGRGTGTGQGRGNPRDVRANSEAERLSRQAAEDARKRAERNARLRPKLQPSGAATDAWAAANAVLRADCPVSTFALWIAPITCLGEAEGALCLGAPGRIYSWVERRYGHWIGETVRELSNFSGVYLLLDETESALEDSPL